MPLLPSKACGIPASKNEEGRTGFTRFFLCIDDFDADPFDESALELRSLQTGVITS